MLSGNGGEKGAATITVVIVIILLGVMISSLLPMLRNEVGNASRNRDVLEAQYAAEAGLKRSLLEFNKPISEQDWTWRDAPVRYTTNDPAKTKTYTVNVNPDPTGPGPWIVTSRGAVGGAFKTISVDATASGGTTAPTNPTRADQCAVYLTRGAVNFDTATTIIGACTVTSPSASRGTANDSYSGGYQYLPNTNLDATLPNEINPSSPLFFRSQIGVLSQYPAPPTSGAMNGNYYSSGWSPSNATFTGNGTIYINGDALFSGNVTFNGNFTIVFDGRFVTLGDFRMPSGAIIGLGNATFQGTNNEITGSIILDGNAAFQSSNQTRITYPTSVRIVTFTNWRSP